MSSKYQMWLSHNAGAEKLRFPVLPEQISISNGSRNKSVDVTGLGEVVIKQDRPALQFSFQSFFPATSFPGIQIETITPPETIKEKIQAWKDSDQPSCFSVTGTKIDLYCTIEDFSCDEKGGDVGTIHYSLTLKEYRTISVDQVEVDTTTQTATLPPETETRTDNRETPKTYTVVKGDCLWNIAAKHLGSGSRYMEIYEMNTDQLKNPSLIYPGQVLQLPS